MHIDARFGNKILPVGVEILRQSEALALLMTRPDIYLRNGIYASSPKSVYEERISAKRSISIKKATRRPLYWREERIYLPFLEFFS
jgi:hypothetical protein